MSLDDPGKVGVIGWYGHGNLGDELMLERFVSIIASATAQPAVVVTDVPERVSGLEARRLTLWRSTFRVARTRTLGVVPWLRGLILLRSASGATLRDLQGLILGGGSLFGHDANDMERWMPFLRRARRMGKWLVLYGIGFGRSTSRSNLRLFRELVAEAELVVLRDARSVCLLEEASSADHVVASADPLYSLWTGEDEHSATRWRSPDLSPVVAMCPRQGMHWTGNARFRRNLIHTFTRVAESLAVQGWKVLLLPFWAEGDVPLCEEIASNVASGTPIRVAPAPRTFSELAQVLDVVSLVLAMPLHAMLLALLCRVPVVPLSYHVKCQQFCNEVGIESLTMNPDFAVRPCPDEVLLAAERAQAFFAAETPRIEVRLGGLCATALHAEARLLSTLSALSGRFTVEEL